MYKFHITITSASACEACRWKGNRVKIPGDPVTVIREQSAEIHCMHRHMRRGAAWRSESQETCLYCEGLKFPRKTSFHWIWNAWWVNIRNLRTGFMHFPYFRARCFGCQEVLFFCLIFLRKRMVTGSAWQQPDTEASSPIVYFLYSLSEGDFYFMGIPSYLLWNKNTVLVYR